MRVAALVLLLCACHPTQARPSASACTGAVTDAAWLAGGWRDAAGAVEELWTSAAGRTMLGVGRTVVDGGTMAFEFMRIEARADGLVFIGHPSAGPGVEFRRTACDPDFLRFENPAHDFPRVIEYRRTGARTMTATVAGPDGASGRLREAIEFRREAAR